MATQHMLPARLFEEWFGRAEDFWKGDLFARFPFAGRMDKDDVWRPSADVIENKDEYLVKAHLPEVKKDDVKVDVADGMLRIRGERRLKTDDKKDAVRRIETFYGQFERSFTLPDNVDAGAIKAECADGVLTVHLPKTTKAEVKPVEISVQ